MKGTDPGVGPGRYLEGRWNPDLTFQLPAEGPNPAMECPLLIHLAFDYMLEVLQITVSELPSSETIDRRRAPSQAVTEQKTPRRMPSPSRIRPRRGQ